MQVNIQYTRLSARGTMTFCDELLSDDGRHVITYAALVGEMQLAQSKAFWKNNMLARGLLLGALRKHFFYGEHFALLECLDSAGALAGYYVDIATPVKKVGADYALTDLFLDYWLTPGQPPLALDEDEFDEAVALGVMTAEQITTARSTFARLSEEIAAGIFPQRYIQG